MTRKIVGWLLIIHGIICTLGAFYPIYPPIVPFSWLAPFPSMVEHVLVLLFGVFQIVCGVYLVFIERLRHIRLYWLAIVIIVVVLLLLIYPALHYFFGI